MTAAISIVGQKFSYLTVKERAGSTKHGQSQWLCECVCGNERAVPWPSLKGGQVKSCGCAWKRNFDSSRICSRCKVDKPHSEFSPGNGGGGLNSYCKPCAVAKNLARYYANPEPVLRRQKASRAALREMVLAAYGSKCACCGEEQKLFLAIDHVNNDGAEHRKKVGKSDAFYRWLVENNYPSEFQILCCNCNWGKYVNGGVCPHKSIALG